MKKAKKQAIFLTGLVAVLGVIAFLCVRAAVEKVEAARRQKEEGGRSADREEGRPQKGTVGTNHPFPPLDWTHRELAAYLEQKGVKVKVEPMVSRPDMTAARFKSTDDEEDPGAVVVLLCADPKKAREEAGSYGEGAFHRERFAFALPGNSERHRALLKRIADVLK